MKHVQFMAWMSLVVLASACKKEPKEPEYKKALQVNFYESATVPDATDVPQITIKDETFQITAIGDNVNGIPQRISKVYLSDTETDSEWVALLDASGQPTFVYQINSATGEQEQDLYWYHRESESVAYLRYYAYDWTNRLGTLRYEQKITDGNRETTFDGTTTQASLPDRIASFDPVGRVGAGKTLGNRSFQTPVFSIGHRTFVAADGGESSDDDFDRGVYDLMESLRSLKDELFDGICDVNKASGGRGVGCRILDVLKEVTDREIFDDIDRGRREQEQRDDRTDANTYRSNLFDLDLGIFDLSEVGSDLQRHFNNIRDNVRGVDFSELIDRLFETIDVMPEDLDDLTDSRGVIHIGLSWNSDSDIDLHVVDPFGERIYFGHTTSQSGGYLDRDDVDGYGPENIYWGSNAPDGKYTVYVHYYDHNSTPVPASQYRVRIVNGLGAERATDGVLTAVDETDQVITFTRQGGHIIFD